MTAYALANAHQQAHRRLACLKAVLDPGTTGVLSSLGAGAASIAGPVRAAGTAHPQTTQHGTATIVTASQSQEGHDMPPHVIALQVALGLVFVGIGGAKLGGTPRFRSEFARFGYPRWFLAFTGAVELVGGLLMLAGLTVPALALLAVGVIAATMLGAAITHLHANDPATSLAGPLVLLAITAVLGAFRFAA